MVIDSWTYLSTVFFYAMIHASMRNFWSFFPPLESWVTEIWRLKQGSTEMDNPNSFREILIKTREKWVSLEVKGQSRDFLWHLNETKLVFFLLSFLLLPPSYIYIIQRIFSLFAIAYFRFFTLPFLRILLGSLLNHLLSSTVEHYKSAF